MATFLFANVVDTISIYVFEEQTIATHFLECIFKTL